MARLIINATDFSEKLHSFSLRCVKCGAREVTLDLDWAAYPSASWCKMTVICDQCHTDEVLYESS
jgi:hypothetical protein